MKMFVDVGAIYLHRDIVKITGTHTLCNINSLDNYKKAAG
ncbi:MAG: hypothetical protein ACI8XW_001558 [Gammaproteobacteria bacterium]|jgi:hypothetical protein